jgi:hypothetical protein
MKAKPIIGKQPTRFGELMASLDTDNVDLKITVMQLINAMLSTGDDDDHKDIKETFTIDKVVDTLRKGQMKEALHVQLDIFDQMMDDLSHSEDVVGDREYPFPPSTPSSLLSLARIAPQLSILRARFLGRCCVLWVMFLNSGAPTRSSSSPSSPTRSRARPPTTSSRTSCSTLCSSARRASKGTASATRFPPFSKRQRSVCRVSDAHRRATCAVKCRGR